MTSTVSILRRAQKEWQRLPQEDYARVREARRAFAPNPRPAGCRALTGRAGWRIRVGDDRVIYEIDAAQPTVTMLHVGHRRDISRCVVVHNLGGVLHASLESARGCRRLDAMRRGLLQAMQHADLVDIGRRGASELRDAIGVSLPIGSHYV